MNYCAHIFVGKEFSALVPTISEQILRTGGDFASCVYLYVLDGNKLIEYKIPQASEIEIIKGNAEAEEILLGDFDVNNNAEAASFFQDKIYNEIVYSGRGSLLHIQIHLPLYKADALDKAIALYDSLFTGDLSKKAKKVDFVCYADDLQPIIEPSYKISSESRKQVTSLQNFKQARSLGFTPHFVVMQNCTINGISLRLDASSLADVVATYTIGCAEQYDALFPTTRDYKDVVAFGFMRLSLDKYRFIEYLMNKALVGSMDQSEINNSDVDINKAWEAANLILRDKTKLLSALHAEIEKKVGKDEEIVRYQNELKESIEEIITRCNTEFEHRKGITMRAAILAAMLNKTECELFSNTLFNANLININDLYSEPISFFADNNTDNFYQIGNEPIVNPLKELKDVTGKLINALTQAKFLQTQLKDIESNIDASHKVEDCYVEDGKFVFHGQHFRLLPSVVQEPLEQTYEAHESLPASADLKSYFNGIKNQGEQGSCLAHALASIFEYAMKRNSQKEVDLSEAFLYYNARLVDGDESISVSEDSGSRFKPALDSLAQFGISLERYCRYNDQDFNKKPSEEAYADAATRKLLVAMNVKRTVADVRSAVADGYPVAASFTLKESFFHSTDGYIPMPTEEEMSASDDSSMHSNHAMVVVGYSDSLKHFVVRNSWGTEWGECGYCYLPYEYVENEQLCDFCCIITEVEQLSLAKLETVPSLKVDDSDLRIRRMITNAALNIEMSAAESYRKEQERLRVYLEQEKKMLSAPNLKDGFISHTEEVTELHIQSLTEERKKKEFELEDWTENFRKKKIRYYVIAGLSAVAWVAVYFGLSSLFDWSFSIWPFLVVLIGGLGFFVFKAVMAYKEWKETRDDLNRAIQQLSTEIKRQKKYLEKFRVRTNTAWALIHALETTEMDLHKQYNNLISLINNLRVWYGESQQYLANHVQNDELRVPVMSLISYPALDTFYEEYVKDSSEFSIDFCAGIENHDITSDYLRQYKERLMDRIITKLLGLPLLRDFNITEHIASPIENAIAPQITHEVWDTMHKMSDVFLHINSVEQGMILPSCTIFAPSSNDGEKKIGRLLGRFMATSGESSLRYDLIMARSLSVLFTECVTLS